MPSDLPVVRGSFWTFNLGHLLILVPMIGSGLWLVWSASALVADHGKRLETIEIDLRAARTEQQRVTTAVAQIKSDVAYLRGRSERSERQLPYQFRAVPEVRSVVPDDR